MNSALARELAVSAGDRVRVRQGDAGEAVLEVTLDDALAAGCVRVAAGHASTSNLGEMFGQITVERA
jgi:NADH-quinone oxidoreductase subunit G